MKHLATQKEIVYLLQRIRLPKGANPTPASSLTGAARKGDLGLAQQFIDAGADINESISGESPLSVAAEAGRANIVDLLLLKGALLVLKETTNSSAIYSAALGGHPEIVRRLIDAGASTKYTLEALKGAVYSGHFDCVKVLIQAVDSKHALNQKYRSQLYNSAKSAGFQYIADLLDGKPVNVEAALSAQRAFKAKENAEAAAFERQDNYYSHHFDKIPVLPLKSKKREQIISKICHLIRNGALNGRINKRYMGDTLLMIAAENGHVEVVRALLAAGARVDALTERNSTALQMASDQGYLEIVKLLLQAGADPNLEHDSGYTPLIEAAARGNLEIVRMLLNAGADPAACSNDGATAMLKAYGVHEKQIKELLLRSRKTAQSVDQGVRTGVQTRKINTNSVRGARDFLKNIRQGNPNWSLLIVQAPAEAVARTYAALCKAPRWEQNVINKSVLHAPKYVFVLQLKGQEWTFVLRTLGWINIEDFPAVKEEAKVLSTKLKTRTVTFTGEDTACSSEYEMYENGKSLEAASWSDGDPEYYFKSKLREKPENIRSSVKFHDQFFAKLGVLIPPCCFESDGFEVKLVLEGISKDSVERVDFIALRGR